MSEKAPEYTTEDIQEKATLDLGKNLLIALVDEIRLLKKPWQATGEQEQGAVIERLAKAIDFNVRGAVHILACGNYEIVPGKVEQVVFKDGVKAVIRCNKHIGNVHALAEREGDTVVMIMVDFDTYTGTMCDVNPDPDQPELGLDDHDETGERKHYPQEDE